MARKTQDAASGTEQVPFRLARAFGVNGATGSRIAAVAWGAPGAASTIPLTISMCESDKPGNSTRAAAAPSTWLNKVMLLPVYDDLGGNGANGWYHIVGFASMYVTGYNFNPDVYPSGYRCPGTTGNSGRCLVGHMVSDVLKSTGTFAPSALGTNMARFIE